MKYDVLPNEPPKKEKRQHGAPSSSREGSQNEEATSSSQSLPDTYTYPPRHPVELVDGEKFITMQHRSYEQVLSKSYQGFVYEKRADLPPSLHNRFEAAFEELRVADFFQYDIIYKTPYTPALKTSVKRTLVGDPGITYFYLGLRLFSHPWSDLDENDRAAGALGTMAALNAELAERAVSLGKGGCALRSPPLFNMSLINYMSPQDPNLILKKDPLYGMGRLAVSWHADSSLQPGSTIAVYHTVNAEGGTAAKGKGGRWGSTKGGGRGSAKPGKVPWRLGLRVLRDAEGPNMVSGKSRLGVAHLVDDTTPALCAALESGDLYYMLDDFNHHHQHAVLAGDSCTRYSSTHRVGVIPGQKVQGIIQECEECCSTTRAEPEQSQQGGPWERLREEQALLDQIEFGWIRQFYAQGRRHYESHRWWWEPIKKLTQFHAKLVTRTQKTLESLSILGDSSPCSSRGSLEWSPEQVRVGEVMLSSLLLRQEQLDLWSKRERGQKVFTSMEHACLPIEPPIFHNSKFRLSGGKVGLGEDLGGTKVTEKLKKMLSRGPSP